MEVVDKLELGGRQGDVPSGTGEPRPERDSGKRDYTQMRERDLKSLEIISKTRPTWGLLLQFQRP